MHQYQGIALFDYATAAPYVKIDMHPPEEGASKVKMLSFRFFTAYLQDGIFFSPHKFPGGCNTPGVLIASKKLFQNKVPHGGGGGGTIFWVSESNHRFLADAEEREEPGTPDLIGSGMVIIFYKSWSFAKIIFDNFSPRWNDYAVEGVDWWRGFGKTGACHFS